MRHENRAAARYSPYQAIRQLATARNVYQAGRAANAVYNFAKRKFTSSKPVRQKRRYRYVSNDSTAVSSNGAVGNAHVIKKKSMRRKRKPRAMKLKPKMRAAIKKVVKGVEPRGTFKKNVVSNLWFEGNPSLIDAQLPTTYDNLQKVQYLSVADMFSPIQVMEAAAVLWNDMGQNPASTPPEFGAPGSGSYFQPRTAKVHIRNSYCKTLFKNNSQRTYEFQLFLIAPKKKYAGLEPIGDWRVQLDASEETKISGDSGPNVANIFPETKGSTPAMLPGWNKNWKYERTYVYLAPGQTYTHVTKGPVNETVDFAKLYEGEAFQYRDKNTRFLVPVFHADLIATTSGTVGFYAESNPTVPGQFDGKGVLVQQTFQYDLTMPEQTGFKIESTTPGNMQLNQFRRYAYAVHNYFQNRSGTLIRVDDEQPAEDYDPDAI